MPTPTIVQVEDVTSNWLTAVLRETGILTEASVVNITHQVCGTGQLGDSYRFSIDYDRPNAGPATLVGKFTSKDPTSRDFGRRSGYYRNEIRFYQDLAPTLSMAIPRHVYAGLADNETDFVLLMEDLAPARQVDQLVGCDVDEAAAVLEQAAVLHAASWRRKDLAKLPWLRGTCDMFSDLTDNFAPLVASFSDTYGDLVPEADIQEAAKLVPYAAVWKRVFSEPTCLWHSDLRADNVLFDTEGGQRPAVVLDWQGLGFGRGNIDLAYFLGTSMKVEDRRAHEASLVRHYHQALQHQGVKGYSAEQCWADYRLNAIHGLQVGVFGLGAVKRTERGDRMWQCWIERTAAQVRDLDSYALLRA